MRFLGYGMQTIGDDDIASVVDVLRGPYLTQGPTVERFEAALAERVGARFAVAVANGTAALHIACLAAGMGPGGRGVTSTLTFAASANCLLYCGADADLIDIDPDSLSMAPDKLAAYLARHPETKAVVPVDFAGLSGLAADLRRVAGKRVIIEDACHAFGGAYPDGQPIGCGAYADMTVFSFHPVKPITTAEGGAVVTNDPDLARKLRLLRSHGIVRDELRSPVIEDGQPAPWYYEQQFLGFNYRLTDVQAALGLSQLSKLDGFIARRREIAAFYDQSFAGLVGVTLPQSRPDQRAASGHHLYLVHVDWPLLGRTRTEVMNALKARNIGTQVHYVPVHRQPYHADRLGLTPERMQTDFPKAEAYYAGCLSLPIFPGLTDEEAAYVAATFKDVLFG